MLELQYLWLDDSLPRAWWDSEIEIEHCNYSKMLFTDVNQPGFQAKLPMLLDDFVSHVEGHSKDIRDALLEFWIISVGGKLSNAVCRLKDEKRPGEAEEGAEIEAKVYTKTNSDDDSDDDSAAGEHKSFQKSYKNRMVLEGIEVPKTQKSLSKKVLAEKEVKKKNAAERMVSTAVVLLSRQLRGMCEASLLSLTELFEKISRPLTSEYSGTATDLFIVNPDPNERPSLNAKVPDLAF